MRWVILMCPCFCIIKSLIFHYGIIMIHWYIFSNFEIWVWYLWPPKYLSFLIYVRMKWKSCVFVPGFLYWLFPCEIWERQATDIGWKAAGKEKQSDRPQCWSTLPAVRKAMRIFIWPSSSNAQAQTMTLTQSSSDYEGLPPLLPDIQIFTSLSYFIYVLS